MEPLFRLALIRPAVQQDPDNPSIRIAQVSPFQTALAAAATGDQPRVTRVAVARMFIATAPFIGDPADTPGSAPLTALATALAALEAKPVLANADVVDAVNAAFGANPDDLVNNGALAEALTRLRDSILAIKQLQEEHTRPLEALTNQLRDLEVIARAADDVGFPTSGAALRRYRRRSLQLPTAADLRSILSTRNQEEERRKKLAEAAAERQKHAEALLDTYRRLHHAIGDLTALDSGHFQTTTQEDDDGVAVPDALTPLAMLERQTAFVDRLSELNLGQMEVALHHGEQPRVDPLLLQGLSGAAAAATIAGTIVTHTPRPLSGSPAFKPPALGEVAFRLKPSAAEALTDTTKTILGERNITLAERPLDRIVDVLQGDLDATSKALDAVYGPSEQRSVKRIGNALVTITTTLPTAWASYAMGGMYQAIPFIPLDQRIPHTRGKVAPAGIADLLVVKQQLIGYEGADIAHIENVLKGERKEREHTRRRETEELTFRETETISSEERELESTDRFEMTREASATIKEDASLKAGLSVSGKYGPTVEFSASAEGSMSRSKEEATKSAARFSQDVTQRSATKISERVLERASLRVTTEVIEKDVHALNNVGGAGHISGVYQWVNKVYQAQMFNYGLRTMFDFMVPEPAAYLMEALQSAHASAVSLAKPTAFTLKPNEITETNYHTWVLTYGATDVAPPPEIYKTKSLDYKGGGGDQAVDYSHSGQVTIDDGYRAIQGSVGRVSINWSNAGALVDVVLGRQSHRFTPSSSWVWITSLDNERDSVPFSLVTNYVGYVAVAVEVKCQRTERAMEKWRLETHGKLTTAYKARLSEYEEKLAQLELQAGVAIRGRNPALNLEIMQDELKKNCISILTDQHYDLFDAIDYAWSTALPQIDVFEAEGEGAYVRFFEQAFEWEHLTWVTYPYFWGRKDQWDERLAFEDPDPLFNQFLKAGYCRVSVPARPGFEGAIDHFMTYGELWNGGPLPPISSPLYLPIADEIAERLDRPGDEVPQGDPWTVRIPTTLVHLRADDKLPTWKQDANGNWVEG